MKDQDFLNHLRIASPCPVGWEQMSGDERVRHCRLCDLHVYNISEMTRKEAQSLIETSEGRVCARLFRRADGTIITRDCPVGLRAVRRRVAKMATAALTAILSCTALVMGQKQGKADKDSCPPQVKVSRQISDSQNASSVQVQIFDVAGAVIAGAEVVLVTAKDPNGRAYQRANTSNDEGRVEFRGLAQGTYDLLIKQPGFMDFKYRELVVSQKELVTLNVMLTVNDATVLVGILVYDPEFTEQPHGTIMTDQRLNKLPIRN